MLNSLAAASETCEARYAVDATSDVTPRDAGADLRDELLLGRGVQLQQFCEREIFTRFEINQAQCRTDLAPVPRPHALVPQRHYYRHVGLE